MLVKIFVSIGDRGEQTLPAREVTKRREPADQ